MRAVPISFRAWQSYKLDGKYTTYFLFCQRIHYFCAGCNNSVMETFFNYSVPAAGKHFVGRKNEVHYLVDLLEAGRSVALYGEPKSGKKSVINQAFTHVKVSGRHSHIVEVDMMRTRTSAEILLQLASAVIKGNATSLHQYRDLVNRYLGTSGIVLDEESYLSGGPFLRFESAVTEQSINAVVDFPFELAKSGKQAMILYFTQFQNIMFADDAYAILRRLEQCAAQMSQYCNMVFTGSRFNAMKDIFEVKRFFWKDVVIFPIEQILPADIAEYVYKGFQFRGKVIEKAVIYEAAEILRYNMWYINHVFSIVDHAALGYVNKTAIMEAVHSVMAIHESRFFAQVTDLTNFQINLLRAVMDGETKFSGAGVIEKYGLSSSANVKRLKDALMKKEVLWFDAKDEPHVQDPLFEMWLREEYFGKTEK